MTRLGIRDIVWLVIFVAFTKFMFYDFVPVVCFVFGYH